jgi:hypothetical protein
MRRYNAMSNDEGQPTSPDLSPGSVEPTDTRQNAGAGTHLGRTRWQTSELQPRSAPIRPPTAGAASSPTRPRRRGLAETHPVLGGLLLLVLIAASCIMVSVIAGQLAGAGSSSFSTTLLDTATPDATALAAPSVVALLEKSASIRFEPVSGVLDKEDKLHFPARSSHLFLQDFIAEAHFTNPYAGNETGWDYGFVFRATRQHEYRLSVLSNRRWRLDLIDVPNTDASPSATVDLYDAFSGFIHEEQVHNCGEGIADNLNTFVRSSNFLRVIVEGPTGYFFVNDKFIARLDVSSLDERGNIMIGSGFEEANSMMGSKTPYKDFAVWKVP